MYSLNWMRTVYRRTTENAVMNSIKKSRKDTTAEIFNFIGAWREQAALSSSPRTVEAYKNAMDLYVRFLDQSQHVTTGDFTWKCFSRENIEKWMQWLAQRGNKPQTVTCVCPTCTNSSNTWRVDPPPNTATSTMRLSGSNG